MVGTNGHICDVYGRLAAILRRPEAFGLGPTIPQPLADALEEMLETLGEVMEEEDYQTSEDRLEQELSQDADQVLCNVS